MAAAALAGPSSLLPPTSSAAAVDANSDTLALAFVSDGAYRVRLFAAVSWRLLLDVALPLVPVLPAAPTALRLSARGTMLAWADDTGGLHAFRVDALRLTPLLHRKLASPASALGGG